MLWKNSQDYPRPGKVLVIFVLVLTALLGMLGLVMDGGLLMAAHRQTQNAADAGAVAAAMQLIRGNSTDAARQAATTAVTTHNGLANAVVRVNMPPTSGPYAGNGRFVEVIVELPMQTIFMHAAGTQRNQRVRARAVAGYEPVASGEGAIVLDPEARPGLAVSGGGTLRVRGAVVVNSRAAGLDQYGQTVDWGLTQYALTSSNNSTVVSNYIQVRGGVDVVANYRNIDPDGPHPLFARATIGPDPLRELPTPVQANVTGITNWTRQAPVTVSSGETRTFTPGVYEDIQLNQGATVIFSPGIYIFSPTKPNQGLRANGSCTVTGDGVMFYMTGSNYLDVSPGYYDARDDAQSALDGPLPPTNAGSIPPTTDPQPNQVKFATMDFNATNARVTLVGLKDENSPFKGILFYQRRRNMSDAAIQGQAGVDVNLAGTMYAKWARFKLAGGGKYDAQFIVGSMAISGQAEVTINSTGKSFGRANQVFLVE